jgi:mannose-6-phosphate isomerase-like protein (cupin superfamily)
MNLRRRDLGLLLPLVAAARGAAQEKPSTAKQLLPSKVYHSKEIAYTGNAEKKGREFFHGVNHTGFALECHETILGPGVRTHAPHKHEHEEVIFIFEGTAEVFVDGKTEPAEAGSVVYLASNQMHSFTNGGTTPLRYYVIELRGHEA